MTQPTSERRCVVTRRSLPSNELLRLERAGSTVVPTHKGGARGAYVSVDGSVLAQLNPGVLARGFKCSPKAFSEFELAPWLGQVRVLAEGHVLAALGLARRQGQLVLGADAVARAAAGVRLCATDLSPGSLRKLPAHTPHFERFLSTQIGRALGVDRASVVLVEPGRHAESASYWLRVCAACDEAENGRPQAGLEEAV